MNAETATSGESLTLLAGTGNISVTGPVGTSTANRLGALVVTSGSTVVFSGAVYAASYLQSAGSVSTTFNGVEDYTGNYDFTGTILNVNDALTVGGWIEITNTGLFTKSSTGVVGVTGTFTQNGSGLNSLGANITTTNNNLSFATAITLLEPVQLSTGAGAGPAPIA